MNDGCFDNTLDVLNSICRRKLIVQEKLANFNASDCSKTPGAPCCLLQTELDALEHYKNILERELFHERPNSSDIVEDDIPDWVRRLQVEWRDLCIRMEKLDNFRDRFREGDIDFTPKWEERLLCDQLRAMRMYRDCLLQYAKIEGIELDMSLYNDDYRYDYYFAKNTPIKSLKGE